MCVFAGEDDDFIDKTDSVLPPTTVSVEIVD